MKRKSVGLFSGERSAHGAKSKSKYGPGKGSFATKKAGKGLRGGSRR